jgi:hypothetical protein
MSASTAKKESHPGDSVVHEVVLGGALVAAGATIFSTVGFVALAFWAFFTGRQPDRAWYVTTTAYIGLLGGVAGLTFWVLYEAGLA